MNRATDAELAAALITWRRELHRHPETGWTEFWTTAFAADVLHSLGYAPRVGREILNARPCRARAGAATGRSGRRRPPLA